MQGIEPHLRDLNGVEPSTTRNSGDLLAAPATAAAAVPWVVGTAAWGTVGAADTAEVAGGRAASLPSINELR